MLACVFNLSAECFWGLVPFWLQIAIVVGVALIVFGVCWNIYSFITKIGGWPAAAGVGVITLGIITAALIGGRKAAEKWKEPVTTGGTGIKLPNFFNKSNSNTTKRVFNSTTNRWENVD